MAELKNEEEEEHAALHAKRKSDLTTKGKDIDNEAEDSMKKQKLYSEEKISDNSKDEDDEEEEEYEGEDDDEEESEGEEHSNGEAQIDRKGKGIMKEDKGKGKLVEESDDSSEADDSESDGDSDLSDDPLAEVDLDNILPSRTRRRVVQPGLYIKNDQGKDSDA